jgi:hypothetical protein
MLEPIESFSHKKIIGFSILFVASSWFVLNIFKKQQLDSKIHEQNYNYL